MFNTPGDNPIVISTTELPGDPGAPARLILIMGQALLTLGSPAHRLEAALSKVAERLALKAQFFSTPSALFAAIGDADEQHTYLIRAASTSGTDMSRLSDILDVVEHVAIGGSNPTLATQRITAILERPPLYPAWSAFLAYIILGAPVALLLGGGWNEALLGGAAGAVVGITALLTRSFAGLGRLFVPLAATTVSFLTMSWCAWQQQTELMPALMAGLIALLPGLDLTIATRELSTGHVVSGSSRLASAVLVFATLAFGLALGGALAQNLFGMVVDFNAAEANFAVKTVAALAAAVGFLLLFNAHLRDWVWIFAAVLVAWLSNTFGTLYFGTPLGAFVGGLAVGIAGNLYARFSGRPGSTLHIPGLLLLVPGTVGFRSLNDLLNADVVAGIQTGFLAVLTAVALTTGMIVSSTLINPKNEL